MTTNVSVVKRTIDVLKEELMHPTDRPAGLELSGCPACAAPAEITDRFVLESTDGPVEHVSLHYVRRHLFRMPTERLPAVAQSTTEDEEPQRWTRATAS
jgi:hypothetical protein